MKFVTIISAISIFIISCQNDDNEDCPSEFEFVIVNETGCTRDQASELLDFTIFVVEITSSDGSFSQAELIDYSVERRTLTLEPSKYPISYSVEVKGFEDMCEVNEFTQNFSIKSGCEGPVVLTVSLD